MMKKTLIIFFFFFPLMGNSQFNYFSKRYEFSGYWDGATSVLETDSGYLISGETGYGGMNGKVALLFMDEQGVFYKKKSYAPYGLDYYAGSSGSLIKTFDSGYALGGSINIFSGNGIGVLWKFLSNGDTAWMKRFGDSTQYFEAFYQCKQTPDSGFILIGATDAPAMGGNTDIWLVKTDKNGTLQWEKTYGGGGVEYGFNVIITKDGDYLLSGYTNSFGAGDYDAYVIKTDNMGNVKWSKTYGGPKMDGSFTFVEVSDGYYVGCGAKLDTILLEGTWDLIQNWASIIKIDADGNLIWQKKYGPSRYGAALINIHELSDGSIVASGQSNNNKGTPNGNGWPIGVILKITANGDSVWYREYEHDSCEKNDDYFRDMKPTSDGGFIVAGFFTPNTSFQCNDTGTQDMWVIKLDSCGCAWLGCDSACQGLVSINEKYKMKNEKLLIQPNPTEGKFNVKILNGEEEEKPYQIKIYDILGAEIKQIKAKSQKVDIDISDFSGGVYLIQIRNDRNYYTTRIVKY